RPASLWCGASSAPSAFWEERYQQAGALAARPGLPLLRGHAVRLPDGIDHRHVHRHLLLAWLDRGRRTAFVAGRPGGLGIDRQRCRPTGADLYGDRRPEANAGCTRDGLRLVAGIL